MSRADGNMKLRVARTMKWNVVDKVATQVLYAVTGVILARTLTQTDFGLVTAVMVFQAFAPIFIDSGFSYALIQRKNPTDRDYSTVMWFNLGVAMLIYLILFFCAPLIADCFQGDTRIVPLARVMFLTFIVNATAMVQTSRFMKNLDVKMIAVSNSLGLIVGGVVGIWLAISGYGAWAIVWQTMATAIVKSVVLWVASSWRPMFYFSWRVLKSFFHVSVGMMGASFLNILFQNIYAFFIGHRVGVATLGYYGQADKWSKMGVSSISAVLTQSFLPALSDYQDQPERFAAATAKMNRTTAYLTFPAMGFLAAMATSVFHALFGEKWDPAIVLFQLLLFRGIFTVLTAVYNHYVLALGKSRLVVVCEAVRDGVALLAIFITLPYIAIESPSVTSGVAIFLWGQVAASIVSWGVMLFIAARLSFRTPWQFIADCLPYAALSLLVSVLMWVAAAVSHNAWIQIAVQGCVGLSLYMTVNAVLGSRVQKDILGFLMSKKAPEV